MHAFKHTSSGEFSKIPLSCYLLTVSVLSPKLVLMVNNRASRPKRPVFLSQIGDSTKFNASRQGSQVSDHPLLVHKLTLLRDRSVARLLAYNWLERLILGLKGGFPSKRK